MGNEIELKDAGREYAAAHAAHYGARDLPKAIQLYRTLIASHPDTPEADYSWTQVRNIVSTVIPKPELQDAQITLVLAHFEREGVGSTSEPPSRHHSVRVHNRTENHLVNPAERMLP